MKIFWTFDYLIYFIKELVISNVRVGADILRKKPLFNPALVKVPLKLKNPWAIMLYANSITLTPGTISVDVSEDKKSIYIHTLYWENNVKAFVESLQDGFEKKAERLFA
jgi:multicomponent Na+:H+ antiporter subunit E